MKKEKIRDYDISFVGLKLGTHKFDFQLEQSFFDLFEFEQDFIAPNIGIDVELEKMSTMLEISLTVNGNILTECDITTEEFRLDLEGKSKLIVKFGEEEDFTDDEIWIVPHGEHALNIAQLIYETVLLSIPTKRIHPDVLNGKSESKILEQLNQLEPKQNKLNEDADPRWAALKKLKNNN